MGLLRNFLFLIVLFNAALFSYDYSQGGSVIPSILDNVKTLTPEKITDALALAPKKLANALTATFDQLKHIKKPDDLLNIFRSSPFSTVYADEGSNVLALDPSTFDQVIDGSRPALVEFYAPWCGHCKSLKPIYEELADSYVYAKDQVIIAKVDADAHKDLGGKFGVTGFPTLKWFPKGVTAAEVDKVEDYKAGRDLDAFASFIKDKTGLRARVKVVKSDVTSLTTADFDKIVLDKNKDVLVEFYASWCGHCKNLAPIYEKVGTAFASEPN
ncbi:thioredoxin-like protein, partial [Endogone sp. FLAS-F59071]